MFMVMFTSAEGKPSQHPAETLDEAVAFVERLRNSESVTDTRLYKMTEVPLEVKAYYKVEIGAPEASPNGLDPAEELNPAI
jgi:hypothetical protein